MPAYWRICRAHLSCKISFGFGVAAIVDNQNVTFMRQTRLNDRADCIGVVVVWDEKKSFSHCLFCLSQNEWCRSCNESNGQRK